MGFCGTLRVEHFAKRGFEFFLLPSIVHAHLVVEPVETHLPVPRRSMRGLRKPLGELMGDPDPEKSKRVTDAMLKMQKIIVADLQKAYDG